MKALMAKDYMQVRPITFKAEMMVQSAVAKFINSNQLGGPVIDEAGL
jgi:predicted transcriptional regulator